MELDESAVPAPFLEAPGELRDGRGRLVLALGRSPDTRTPCRAPAG